MIRHRADIFRLLILATLIHSAHGVEFSIYLENVSSNDSGLADYANFETSLSNSNYSAEVDFMRNSSLKTSYNTSLMPGWMVLQGTNMANSGHLFKGEYGKSVEDLIGVFSIKKVIKLLDNSSCNAGNAQWMPCI